ncbi:hypothetical protein, partial [Roseomonas rosulenta]|uniref:hypothetical protein n=1 Tax=Roseomonas rosulenta TaxID=2748667 RepID=UPI001E435814
MESDDVSCATHLGSIGRSLGGARAPNRPPTAHGIGAAAPHSSGEAFALSVGASHDDVAVEGAKAGDPATAADARALQPAMFAGFLHRIAGRLWATPSQPRRGRGGQTPGRAAVRRATDCAPEGGARFPATNWPAQIGRAVV